MEYTRNSSGDICRVVMSGKFTFSDHIEFKNIFKIFEDNMTKHLEIDLSKVEFVDSAALGLLLLVLDEAAKTNVKLKLLRPCGHVQKMFKISRFYDLFNIVD